MKRSEAVGWRILVSHSSCTHSVCPWEVEHAAALCSPGISTTGKTWLVPCLRMPIKLTQKQLLGKSQAIPASKNDRSSGCFWRVHRKAPSVFVRWRFGADEPRFVCSSCGVFPCALMPHTKMLFPGKGLVMQACRVLFFLIIWLNVGTDCRAFSKRNLW